MKPASQVIFWSFIFTAILLTLWTRVHQSQMTSSPVYTEYTNRIIYIDDTFSDKEGQIIQEAADEWRLSTDGRVNYNVLRLPVKNLDVSTSIVMVKKTPYDPEVLELDFRDKNLTMGYFNHTEHIHYIGLVMDRIPPADYKTVLLHEFGHSLGLKHNETSMVIHSIMRPLISECSRYISDTDLYNFCQIHNCNSWNLHDQEEPSHP